MLRVQFSDPSPGLLLEFKQWNYALDYHFPAISSLGIAEFLQVGFGSIQTVQKVLLSWSSKRKNTYFIYLFKENNLHWHEYCKRLSFIGGWEGEESKSNLIINATFDGELKKMLFFLWVSQSKQRNLKERGSIIFQMQREFRYN